MKDVLLALVIFVGIPAAIISIIVLTAGIINQSGLGALLSNPIAVTLLCLAAFVGIYIINKSGDHK